MQRAKFLFILSISCLALLPLHSIAKNHTAMVEKLFNAYDFDKIIADGYFTLDIIAQKSSKSYLTSTSYPNSPINITIHDHTLYIMSRYQHQKTLPKPTVTVSLAKLNSLIVYGPTAVTSKHLPGDKLKLSAHGYGKITIKQIDNLKTLSQKGNSVINISGINSQTLAINSSGFGKMTLQGKADTLYARLSEASLLQARNLSVKHIIVQTSNDAEAYVHATKSLRAFATQASAIYYYKHLDDLTSQPIQSGNVLEMPW